MRREDVPELHYIIPIRNVQSVLSRGILSHNRAKRIEHESVAMQVIQERRDRKVVSGGMPLHDYVNLYINARNRMLYKLKSSHNRLCVLRVSMNVLNLDSVVITDHNAASGYARFYPSPIGLDALDRDEIFARYWTHDDEIATFSHKSRMCAEVLVPHRVDPTYILGVCISDSQCSKYFLEGFPTLECRVNPYLFFR